MTALLPGFSPDYSLINGLKYIQNYISSEEETDLLVLLDKQTWILDLKRRVQHYGYRYDYKLNRVTQEAVASIPEFLLPLCHRLVKEGIFSAAPNQIIVNEYLPGLGITSHIDAACFGNTVCSLSLGTNCVMNFTKDNLNLPKILESKSLLVLKEEARYNWSHEIPARKLDNFLGCKFPRGKRVSITFRIVL
jgi:alkylated DNA repair dioxygenase AlkB